MWFFCNITIQSDLSIFETQAKNLVNPLNEI